MQFGVDEPTTVMPPGYGERPGHTHGLVLAPEEIRPLKIIINQTKKARPFVHRQEHLPLHGESRR